MNFSFTRAASFINTFGWWYGLKIYVQLKCNRLNSIQLPGILFPFSLRKNTSDKAVFDQVFIQAEYAFEISFTPKIIIDAGANIGLFSILMKKKFPDVTIIAVEPDVENMELLKYNCASYPGINPVLAGLCSKDCRLKLNDEVERGKSGIMLTPGNERDSITGISIDSILANFNIRKIDILKIDIECSEKELFCRNYETWLPKTKIIIIELHDWISPGCAEVFFKAVQKSFKNFRYSICGENTIIENLDI